MSDIDEHERIEGVSNIPLASGRLFGGAQTDSRQPANSAPALEGNTFEENIDNYPEGGKEAWLVVLGSWCAITATAGVVNSSGVFQSWLQANQLQGYSDSQIGWIFGVYLFLFFLGGVQVGPIFDAYGLAYVTVPGYIGAVASLFFLSVSEKYYQIMLGFAILGGLSDCLVFTPSITVIGHWFYRRRGLATGLACTGGAVAGVVFPLVFDRLIDAMGFGWAIRVVGFCVLGLCAMSFALLKARQPITDAQAGNTPEDHSKHKAHNFKAQIDLSAFKDLNFTLTVIATYMVEWALFVPLTYITTYAVSGDVDSRLSHSLLPILNAGSVIGRGLPGYLGDKWGRFNVMIITTFCSGLSILALWLPAGNSPSLLIAFALLFGVFSGTGVSMTPVCVSQVCHTKDYGKRYGTCYTVVSFGSLTGIPIGGRLIAVMEGRYTALILWTGVVYMIGSAFFLCVRLRVSGWNMYAKY